MAVLLLFLVLLFLVSPHHSDAQQPYVNNKQLNCTLNDTATLGFTCNGASPSCDSYLTFRSTQRYNNPFAIGNLLNADPSAIATANNISNVTSLPTDTLLVIPITCTCTNNNYYQHNARYTLEVLGETYFSVANYTYQALTTCQSMLLQNPYDLRSLVQGMNLTVPLRCACPTTSQMANGFRYLLTYLIRQGEDVEYIAGRFSRAGADPQSLLDANELTSSQDIFFFTPILVPLRTQPTSENINTGASPPPPATPPVISTTPNTGSGSGSRRWVITGVGVGVGILFLFGLGLVVVWWFYFRRRRRTDEEKSSLPPPTFAEESGRTERVLSNWSETVQSAVETLAVYRFEDLENATDSFADSNRIDGSSVYRGCFRGDNAVVKVMKGDVSREIDLLRQINHSRVVRLSGFCLHRGVTYLVYEYAEGGSLDRWLHHSADCAISKKGENRGSDKSLVRLDWKQRVQIAYDVADALNYLHNFTNPPYIHKNLKSSNVLLDGSMRAKIANFGLARLLDTDEQNVMTRHVVGTYGYMAPEYIENGLITPKLDVFAFGVVILELLSGREPITKKVSNGVESKDDDGDDQILLCHSVEGVLSGEDVKKKLQEFMDPWLGEEYPLELAYSMAQLARSCVAQNLDDRPPVSEVFMVLSKLLSSSLDWDPSHEEFQHSTSFSLSD